MRIYSRIVIIGRYPPPIGGISVHIQRVATECLAKGLSCVVIDPYDPITGKQPSWVIRFPGNTFIRFIRMLIWLVINSYQVIHIHVSAMDKFLLIGWIINLATLKARRKIITIHSGSFIPKIKSRGIIYKVAITMLLKHFHYVVVVNSEQKEYLKTFLNIKPDRICIIPAFIAPQVNSSNIPNFIRELREKVRYLVVGSGFATPLYAHEILIDAIYRLREEGLSIALILVLYTEYEEPYFSLLKNKINNLPDSTILQDLTPETFNELLRLADIYVRTARRDGDSVAVREALLNGCWVIASDVVARPEGCIIFPKDNIESLYSILKEIVTSSKNKPANLKTENYLEDLISLYEI